MSLSDDIKLAILPYLGKPLTLELLQKVQLEVAATAIASQNGIQNYEIELIQKQSQIYITLKLMVDSIQNQIDTLNTQVAALQASVTTINATLNGLTIGSDVQAWDVTLQAIADLTLGANKYLGTNNANQIIQYDLQRRQVGETILLPYDPALSSWSVSGAIYTDPDGWLWYFPNGTALSNVNTKYLNLFTALWGTAAYTISGGKGANALADWNASKQLIIPDLRGRAIATQGTATGGSTSRSIGGVWGAENVTLAITNLPAHRHNITIAGFTATALAASGATGLGGITYGSNTVAINQANIPGNRAAANDGLGAIADTGSGTAFSISDPTKAYFELWFMNTK